MKKTSMFYRSILYVCIGLIVGVTIHAVSAWVEPDQMPPGGNIAAPLNTSNVGQTKTGGLVLNSGGATLGLLVQKGEVIIGEKDPNNSKEAEGIYSLKVFGNIYARNMNLNNNLNVGGDTNIGGNLTVNGNTNLHNTYVNGNMNVNGDIYGKNIYGNVNSNSICLGGNCYNSWPTNTGNDSKSYWEWNTYIPYSWGTWGGYDLVSTQPDKTKNYLNENCFCTFTTPYYTVYSRTKRIFDCSSFVYNNESGLKKKLYSCAESCSDRYQRSINNNSAEMYSCVQSESIP